jgi:hypothetical protein
VTSAVAVTEPVFAVITAVPLPAAETRPVPVTVATPGLLDVQVIEGDGMGEPSWSVTLAVIC